MSKLCRQARVFAEMGGKGDLEEIYKKFLFLLKELIFSTPSDCIRESVLKNVGELSEIIGLKLTY